MPLQSALSSLFAKAHTVGVAGTFQFLFSDQERFWVDAPASSVPQAGLHPRADVTIGLDKQMFLEIMEGRGDIENLFATGRLKIHGQIGLATLLPQLISARLRPLSSAAPVRMNQRYPAVPRASEHLSAPLLLSSIPRLPAHEVCRKNFDLYKNKGIPLVLSDALDDWPLFKMPKAEALEHLAHVQGITRHGEYARNAFSSEREFRTTPLRDFVATMERNQFAGDEPPAYMGNNQLPQQWLNLIRLPDYFDPKLHVGPRFWLGPRGTLTPLHRDDTDNLFAQVWGEKSMLLAAPHHRQALGSWATAPQGGLEGCDFDPDNPDFERFPSAKNVDFLQVILQPGDLFFLPEGWFHRVMSLSTSLSINFWVRSVRAWKDCEL